jgi:hypothetical protein
LNKVKSIAVVLLLVAGIAIGPADDRTTGSTDGRTFEGAPGLVADHTSQNRTTEGTSGGTALGIWTGWGGTVGECESDKGAGDC